MPNIRWSTAAAAAAASSVRAPIVVVSAAPVASAAAAVAAPPALDHRDQKHTQGAEARTASPLIRRDRPSTPQRDSKESAAAADAARPDRSASQTRPPIVVPSSTVPVPAPSVPAASASFVAPSPAPPSAAYPAATTATAARARRLQNVTDWTALEATTYARAVINNVRSSVHIHSTITRVETEYETLYTRFLGVSGAESISAVRRANLAELLWAAIALGKDPLPLKPVQEQLCIIGSNPTPVRIGQLPADEQILVAAIRPEWYSAQELPIDALCALEFSWANVVMASGAPCTRMMTAAMEEVARAQRSAVVTTAAAAVAAAAAAAPASTATAAASAPVTASSSSAAVPDRKVAVAATPAAKLVDELSHDIITLLADVFYWLRFRIRLNTMAPGEVVLSTGQRPDYEVYNGPRPQGVDEDRLRTYLQGYILTMDEHTERLARDRVRHVQFPLGAWTRFMICNPERNGEFAVTDVAKWCLTEAQFDAMEDQASCRPEFRDDILRLKDQRHQELREEWDQYVKRSAEAKEECAHVITSAKSFARGMDINPDILAAYNIKPNDNTVDIWYLMAFDLYWRRTYSKITFFKHVIFWSDWGDRLAARTTAKNGVACLNAAHDKRHSATVKPFLVHLGHDQWYVWHRGRLLCSLSQYDAESNGPCRRSLICSITLWINIIQREYHGIFDDEGQLSFPERFPFWERSEEEARQERVLDANRQTRYIDPMEAIEQEYERADDLSRAQDRIRRQPFVLGAPIPTASSSSAAASVASSASSASAAMQL